MKRKWREKNVKKVIRRMLDTYDLNDETIAVLEDEINFWYQSFLDAGLGTIRSRSSYPVKTKRPMQIDAEHLKQKIIMDLHRLKHEKEVKLP